jgi:predicted O-methyltransferase YrrM
MEASEIHEHWTRWATQYGVNLRATTKAATPKILELDALTRRLRTLFDGAERADILEVGCGNGVNCVALAGALRNLRFDGVDFVQEMVQAAIESAHTAGAADVRFFVGDVLEMGTVSGLRAQYDAVFTDRCLINLNTLELQKRAITVLAEKVCRGGHLLMIENTLTTYGEQNRCRQILGLQPRTPASFNLFFDEPAIRAHVDQLGLELQHVEDFISLHDLVLYVLVPAINGGKVDYEHPLVKAATTLSVAISATQPNAFGAFGQNRLFDWRKPG